MVDRCFKQVAVDVVTDKILYTDFFIVMHQCFTQQIIFTDGKFAIFVFRYASPGRGICVSLAAGTLRRPLLKAPLMPPMVIISEPLFSTFMRVTSHERLEESPSRAHPGNVRMNSSNRPGSDERRVSLLQVFIWASSTWIGTKNGFSPSLRFRARLVRLGSVLRTASPIP